MFGIGMPELIVILIIGLIILGPKRLPGITKAIGKGIREFKRSIYGLGDDSSPGIKHDSIHHHSQQEEKKETGKK